MTPAPGERLLRHLGDRVTFRLQTAGSVTGWRAFLRTNLGRAQRLRDETITALGGQGTFAGASWRDIPMLPAADGSSWSLDLPLTEIGFFNAKAYLANADGVQRWPSGDDIGVSIHPSEYRTANTVYCAFTRMFGRTKEAVDTRNPLLEGLLKTLDNEGYTVIPPSGTFRDLVRELPHLVAGLGCRILHLLPVGPTPTTYARFGRFGSPYAQEDLVAIDPALVEFDRKATAVDQFRELTAAAYHHGCRVFLDIVINHTGWGSVLQDQHPEWFKRNADGTFHSPGAWGNTWEDLVELDHHPVPLWDTIAKALIEWCRRGVNGFRCDAGYMVPLPTWQYIICRVRQEFPRTVFLLEGLGGAWEATEALLTSGGMQWAYSELFQNYDAVSIGGYLRHCHEHAATRGVLIHYSETHDNERLAKHGREWSLFRNRLCALTSQAGAYGFTAGVEWLAAEKLEVHQSRGMRWGAADNLVRELAALNHLLSDDPVFFAGATVTQVADPTGGVVALLRTASTDWGDRSALVIANPHRTNAASVAFPASWEPLFACELLGQGDIAPERSGDRLKLTVPPLTAWCLAASRVPAGTGDDYRRLRAQASGAYAALGMLHSNEDLGPCDWRALARWSAADPVRFLNAASHLDRRHAARDLLAALEEAVARHDLPPVCLWSAQDAGRVLPVPPACWILVRDPGPFRVTLTSEHGIPRHVEAVPNDNGWSAALPPLADTPHQPLFQTIELVRGGVPPVTGRVVRLLPHGEFRGGKHPDPQGIALLTNGRGGMARLALDLGTIRSKYDCLLGANLHATAPSDRHVLAKRMRVWVSADGFVTALDRHNLAAFEAGPPAHWRFSANAGDGRMVTILLDCDLLEGRNTFVARFSRPADAADQPNISVRLIVRLDLEDRSFHSETHRSPEAEQHFSSHTVPLPGERGFRFTPANERRLTARCDVGTFHSQAEWCCNIPHPVEQDRGMAGSGDAWSPGWFEIPLAPGNDALLTACAEAEPAAERVIAGFATARAKAITAAVTRAGFASSDRFGRQLAIAAQAYLVRRDSGRTVIAGYPWFLDWGRDTFIAARGLLAAGQIDDVRQLLTTFGRFENGGTLPNLLNGDVAENRDTSDAPLWYAVVLEELAALSGGASPYLLPVAAGGRTLGDVVRSIACGYLSGTANGIRVDPQSLLVWSPPHFTWMDTNYPTGTPRTGYPVEIQVLWLRLLRHLARISAAPAPGHPSWSDLAERALASLLRYFWQPERSYFADVLLAPAGVPAAQAQRDDALRPNQIFAVSLGVVSGDLARQVVAACYRHLVVPGALRSLAPLPLTVPLTITASDGRLLADPHLPYCGTYSGDEDTRRKPAYHNGTAWTWPFPSLCEAIVLAWDGSPTATDAARSLLGSADQLLGSGCIGQIPEILDGDAPHAQKGCDAQAWGVTEVLRVWKRLSQKP